MFQRWSWPESAKDKLVECLAKGENRFWVTREEAIQIFNRNNMRPNGFDLDFQRFAFGVTDHVIPLDEQALNLWNSRHGDKLMLHPNGIPDRDIPKMWDIYIENRDNKQEHKMKIIPRKGYVLVSNQDIVEEKKSGSLIIAGEDNKKTYLRLESDGELFKIGDCVFAHPYKTKMQIDDNLYLIAEEDILASFTR